MPPPPTKPPVRLGVEGFGRDAGPAPQGEGYPPYDLERPCGHPERLRLVFALAGFAPDQLDVSVTDRHLMVKGEQKPDGGVRDFLHRGIAARRFQRIFRLADDLEVLCADLNDGLLSIILERRTTTVDVTRIRIDVRN